MATAITVRRYTIDVAYKFDKSSIRQIDKAMLAIEKKLKDFSQKLRTKLTLNISNFSVDQRALNKTIGNSLDVASNRTVFEVSRFTVNQRNLQAAMLRAQRGITGGNGGLGGTNIGTINYHNRNLPASEWSRRQAVSQQMWWERRNALREDAERAALERAGRMRSSAAVGTGGVAGFAARAYLPALGLIGGGYGLSELNQRNQQVVSAQLQSRAVIQQAGGTAVQGNASFDYLRKEADRIGFNYLESSGDYNKLIAGLTGAGVGISESQKVFSGFAELSRVNKLDKTTQNRLFRALSQVAGKGKLQAEELSGQIAEALPGGTAIFAEAYQRQIGGTKTGQEAISDLMAAMKKGQVKGSVLTYAGQIASERANTGGALTSASQASQAEQARFQNTVSNLSITASNNGLESGFARLFRALNDGLKEANPMVESLARGFDQTSKYVSAVFLSVQSLQRFFQGRDSFLGEKLFPSEESQAKAFEALNNLKSLMSEMNKLSTNIYNGWNGLFNLFEKNSVLDKLNNTLSILGNSANVLNKLAEGDFSDAVSSAKAVGQKYVNTITTAGRTGANAILYGGQKALAGLDPRITMDQVTPYQIPTPFSGSSTRSDYDYRVDYKAEQARLAAQSRNQYPLPGINQPLAPGQKAIDLSVKMDVKIEAANPEDFNQKWQDKFRSELQSIMVEYPEKE